MFTRFRNAFQKTFTSSIFCGTTSSANQFRKKWATKANYSSVVSPNFSYKKNLKKNHSLSNFHDVRMVLKEKSNALDFWVPQRTWFTVVLSGSTVSLQSSASIAKLLPERKNPKNG
jgi:hypothetical protein